MSVLTNGNGTSHKRKFPEIVLDTTLAELLAAEPHQDVKQSLCNIKPCADPRHKTVPLNKKFLITSTKAGDDNDLAHLQLENVSYLLSFWAGHMEVPLVACEGLTDDDTLTKEVIGENARIGFSVLNERQRPWASVFANKDDFIKHYKGSDTRVRWGFGVDFAEQIPCFIPPETQYRLNTKRWLAVCSLRSANDRILDPEGFCDSHRTIDGLWYYDTDCSDCDATVPKEVANLKERLENTEPPFVLKLTQSLGSVGTMLVRSKPDRDATIKHITETQLETLPHVNAENAHIFPASLVLSDFLPGDTHALNFYVRGDGSVKFLGSCNQLSTRLTAGGKQHTALTLSHQDRLEKRFRPTLDDIGKVLHDEGYYGPCGADIMETEDGTQYVIDLNVRSATSLVLGCLKGHCQKRNFDACAVYECLLLTLSRDNLETKFEKEFEEGRLILLGNTRLGKKDKWAYPVVLAGEDQDAVKALGARLLKFEATGAASASDAGGA